MNQIHWSVGQRRKVDLAECDKAVRDSLSSDAQSVCGTIGAVGAQRIFVYDQWVQQHKEAKIAQDKASPDEHFDDEHVPPPPSHPPPPIVPPTVTEHTEEQAKAADFVVDEGASWPVVPTMELPPIAENVNADGTWNWGPPKPTATKASAAQRTAWSENDWVDAKPPEPQWSSGPGGRDGDSGLILVDLSESPDPQRRQPTQDD